MNIFQRMEEKKSHFTNNHMIIYEKITEDPGLCVQMTTSALAEACGVSQPALTRFVKDLGYPKYQDFRADLMGWLAEQRALQHTDSNELPYFSIMNQLLNETKKVLTDDYMKELADYVHQFDRVFTTGVSKSFHPADLMETLMFKNNQFVHAVSNDNISELADFMTEKDLLIVFSISAHASLLKKVADSAAHIMLVTVTTSHPYEECIDKRVLLPYVPPTPEESAISPVLFDIFVEILCKYL